MNLKHKILLADNHLLIREGLKSLLATSTCFEIVGEASNGIETLEQAQILNPDIIVIDYDIPGFFSINDIAQLHLLFPHIRVVVISANTKKQDVLKVLDYGVNNYILKLCDTDEVIGALHAATKKEKFFCGKVLDAILETTAFGKENCIPINLTAREIDLVKLVANGNSNKELADQLNLSVHTVYTHKKNIFKKLGLNTSTELVAFALTNGIIEN